jgi:PAS domain S-box-containing protein
MHDGAMATHPQSPLLRAASLGTWEFDLDAQRVRWSSTLEEMHGIPVGSFEGTFEAYQRDIHPDDRERVLTTIGQNIAAKKGHALFYRIVRPDGGVRWLDARGEFMTEPQTGRTRLVGVCADVTELLLEDARRTFLADVTRALVATLDSENTLQTVATLAVPKVADWCAVDVFVDPQERARGLVRVAMAHADAGKVALGREIMARYPTDLTAPGYTQLFASREPLLVPLVTEEMLQASSKDAQHLALARQLGLRSVLIAPIDLRGVIVGLVTFATAESQRTLGAEDVACIRELCASTAIALENERLYREAKEAVRTREDIVGIVGHDLRTPLTAVVLGASSLLRREDVDERTTATARRVLSSAERATRLVRELLDFTQARSGSIPVKPGLTDLDEVVRSVVEELRAVHCERAIDFKAARVQGQWDADRLQQVFTNIIGNALDHSLAHHRVRVHIDVAAANEAVVEVHNEGSVIPSDLLPRLFEPFARGRGAARESRGLGLGLYIANQVVRSHGGRIEVASDDGRGTTFTVRLPR